MQTLAQEKARRRFSLGAKAIGYAIVLIGAASFPTLATIAGCFFAVAGFVFVLVAAYDATED